MNTSEIQIKYDILMTQITAIILLAGTFPRLFHDSYVSVVLLPFASAVGLLFLLSYLLTADSFIDACSRDDNTKTDRLKLASKCCQWAYIIAAAAVIILLAIM